MFVARIKSAAKSGKSYQSVLLRESYRSGSSVKSRTLAVLTKLPDWLIDSIESLLKLQRQSGQTPEIGLEQPSQADRPPLQSLLELTSGPESPLGFHQGESFGALWLLKSLCDNLHITRALKSVPGQQDFVEIALWRICARLLVPGASILSITRQVSTSAARRLFGWKRSWCEDDLYRQHGKWLCVAVRKSKRNGKRPLEEQKTRSAPT